MLGEKNIIDALFFISLLQKKTILGDTVSRILIPKSPDFFFSERKPAHPQLHPDSLAPGCPSQFPPTLTIANAVEPLSKVVETL
jgi:hypothetical protein